MWIYEVKTGRLSNGDKVYFGYSGGDLGTHPEGINNPDDEDLKDIGPIPEGLYTMMTPIEHSHLGPFAIPLIPDNTNDMKGRSGFFMHGDTSKPHSASEGCIIMAKNVREDCWNSNDHRIQVIHG